MAAEQCVCTAVNAALRRVKTGKNELKCTSNTGKT